MTLRILTTVGFPEILSGKSFGLPFLQEFWLYKHSDCLFPGNSGFANLAPACIFFPEAFRIIAKRFPGFFYECGMDAIRQTMMRSKQDKSFFRGIRPLRFNQTQGLPKIREPQDSNL